MSAFKKQRRHESKDDFECRSSPRPVPLNEHESHGI